MSNKKYDIIVIGAGHAGCEAALAAARMGCSVLLTTINLDTIANMPCSPSIGGVAKGHLVKDIDALGGEMAKITDQSAIQYRTLNTKKGPAVRSTRTQNDKIHYHVLMKNRLETQANLEIKQVFAERIVVENSTVLGIVDHSGYQYQSKVVILATGTFLSGLVHIGHTSLKAGRAGEFASYALAENLKNLGLKLGRLKTGTPPRIKKSSIDFSKFEIQHGEAYPEPFSLFTKSIPLQQVPCYIGHTNEKTHSIVRENLKYSALYGGKITGISARYCPSFEDKIVKFPTANSHRVILEPEGLKTEEMYASGLGNSLPIEIQMQLVRSIEGLEEAEIMRPAYAIEYEYINPIQLKPTLETKAIRNLFCAGQINGTSGYEEAAAQGLWAGINAACAVQNRPAFLPDRSQTYIAVMVDDLVTKGTDEPYRMFTSRAEYRLLLREDNADLRLMEKGYELGLIGLDAILELRERKRQIEAQINKLRTTLLPATQANNLYLEKLGSAPLTNSIPADQLLKRPQISYRDLQVLDSTLVLNDPRVIRQVEIEIKYEGYIRRELSEVEKFKFMERISIPATFDYNAIQELSTELKEKLTSLRPLTIGQASRIPGITPAALTALMVHTRRVKQHDSF